MESLVTQVPQSGPATNGFYQSGGQYQSEDTSGGDYADEDYGSSLIHLNICEAHYYITRDQLMSLPESLLLCLFPNGVFLDRNGQVITNLTAEDEVYIPNFFPECFEYIMSTYTKANEDYIYYPVNKIFDRSPPSKGFFSFGSNNNQESAEQEILHEKPTIIVLREDLDYYCVPQTKFIFDNDETNEDLVYHIMAQVKSAAGSYLTSKGSIFEGLYSSNRLKKSHSHTNLNLASQEDKTARKQQDRIGASTPYEDDEYYTRKDRELGPAEKHLKDMLCSSGFKNQSVWGNRFQEPGKTVISSLSLCRIANETTESFREQFAEAKAHWEKEQQQLDSNDSLSPKDGSLSPTQSLSPTKTNQSTGKDQFSARTGRDKRRSRLSALAGNVKSRSTSRQRSQSHQRERGPKLYDLMPKPDINVKLLLFWRKPARKCWWSEEELELDVDIYDSCDVETSVGSEHDLISTVRLKFPASRDQELHKIRIPVRLHIRRVWTLELSIVGVQ